MQIDYINNLPDDVLGLVFHNLTEKDQWKVREVCKKWRRAICAIPEWPQMLEKRGRVIKLSEIWRECQRLDGETDDPNTYLNLAEVPRRDLESFPLLGQQKLEEQREYYNTQLEVRSKEHRRARCSWRCYYAPLIIGYSAIAVCIILVTIKYHK